MKIKAIIYRNQSDEESVLHYFDLELLQEFGLRMIEQGRTDVLTPEVYLRTFIAEELEIVSDGEENRFTGRAQISAVKNWEKEMTEMFGEELILN